MQVLAKESLLEDLGGHMTSDSSAEQGGVLAGEGFKEQPLQLHKRKTRDWFPLPRLQSHHCSRTGKRRSQGASSP